MLSISISQKQIVLDFFAEDIKVVKKYFNAIGFDFDERFRFDVFKEFIYSAAGMFKDIDPTIYNQELVSQFNAIRYLNERYSDFKQRSQNAQKIYTKDFLCAQESYMNEKKEFDMLKDELQMLITKEQSVTAKRDLLEKQIGTVPPEALQEFEHELKKIRREQVDTIHFIGTHRQELEEHQTAIKTFEDLHREEFLQYFNETREKLMHQFTESLNYFGFDFNEALFRDSERSLAIQKFKTDAGIQGPINLCKYVEYYLRNVVPEALADAGHKERLLNAKRYCEQNKAKS
jgi:predicted lactoylglutathione lyase